MDDMHFSFKIENPPAWLPIGRTAENDWRTIEIDCSYWFNMDATGNVVLMYRPSCGMSPYPLLTERDGDNIVWHPKSGELVEGVGQMQAFFYVGESKIGSSKMVSCEVDGSLLGGDPGTDPGAVAPPWAIDIIEQIAVLSGHYPKIIDGNLYIWDSALNEWVEFEASGGGLSDAVLYTEQELTDAQKAQARGNIGAGTYTKPSGGIPASDLASSVIPTVPQMATQSDMSDWTSGKTVDAATLKNGFTEALTLLSGKADISDIPTAVSELTNDSGFQTAPFEIPITRSGSTYTTTATAEEIREHADNCVIVYGKLTFDKTVVSVNGQAVSVNTAVVSLSADKTYAIYTTISVSVDANDAVTVAFRQKQENFLPVTTSADNGKVLGVENGAYELVSTREPRVAMTASNTTAQLDPNKLYVFPTMASLAPTLAAPSDNSIVNEYHFIFTSGATATTLTLPASVLQPDGFTVEANHVYEVSILENCMTAQGWAVSA